MKRDVMFCPVARQLDDDDHYTASCQAEKYIEGGLYKVSNNLHIYTALVLLKPYDPLVVIVP